ncbi:MAG: hypothetical protein ACRCV7_03105 [Culicoidibacterales bacterium]
MRKGIYRFYIITMLIITCTGCTSKWNENTYYPNKDLVQGFIQLNQYLLEHSQVIKGDVVISAIGKGNYEGSGLQIALRSTNEKNSVSLSGNVSSQTAFYILDSLASTQLKKSGIKIDLASVSREYQIGETGNLSSQFLMLDEDILTPFFKTNALYFETESNKVAFAQGLSKRIISSDTEVYRDKGVFSVYVLELQTDSLSYILPFDVPSKGPKSHVRITQNQETKQITHIDIIVYKDKIANQDQSLSFDIDVSLQFNVEMGGQKHE